MLVDKVDYVRLDRMNYHYADKVYRKHGLEEYLSGGVFLADGGVSLVSGFDRRGHHLPVNAG